MSCNNPSEYTAWDDALNLSSLSLTSGAAGLSPWTVNKTDAIVFSGNNNVTYIFEIGVVNGDPCRRFSVEISVRMPFAAPPYVKSFSNFPDTRFEVHMLGLLDTVSISAPPLSPEILTYEITNEDFKFFSAERDLSYIFLESAIDYNTTDVAKNGYTLTVDLENISITPYGTLFVQDIVSGDYLYKDFSEIYTNAQLQVDILKSEITFEGPIRIGILFAHPFPFPAVSCITLLEASV